MLHTVVMGAQQCFHGPEAGALVLCHMALFCLLFFYLVFMGGEGSALAAEAERLFCALAAPDGWLVGLSRSSTALRGSEQVTAMLGRLWDSLLHLLPFLYSSGKPLIANKIGKDFFCGATRSAFSNSEELEE